MSIINFEKKPGGGERELDQSRSFEHSPAARPATRSEHLVTVRKLITDRRRRDRYFDGALFADPAWDILLDLYAAELADEVVCISALCIAAAVPAATALRWIRTLKDAGLVERRDDPYDRRRVRVQLTDCGREKMKEYLRETYEAAAH